MSQLKLKNSGKLPIILKESAEYTSNLEGNTENSQHVTG